MTPELLIAFEQVIDAGCFINGPQFAISSARLLVLHIALRRLCRQRARRVRIGLLALGVERGCEVIVPANTFVATVEAIEQAGLVPVLVDVTDIDYNCDLGAVEAAMTARTQVLLPVHLYGQMADMRALLRLARRRGLAVVEDACQAHGAERDGLRAGSGGHVGAFSFYPGKNLGAMGDAGALVCDDPSLAEHARSLREHGQTSKHRHESVGYTARMDTMQAVVLLQKLPLLEGWTRARRGLADHYAEGLDGVGDLRLPPVPMASEPVWRLYEIRTKHRDPLARFLDTPASSRPPVSDADPSDAGVCASRVSPRRLPGRRAAGRRAAVAAPISRTRRGSGGPRRRNDPRVLSSMTGVPANDVPYRMIDEVMFGDDVIVQSFVNLYGCRIGAGSRVGPFVEIQRGAEIGRRCKIRAIRLCARVLRSAMTCSSGTTSSSSTKVSEPMGHGRCSPRQSRMERLSA